MFVKVIRLSMIFTCAVTFVLMGCSGAQQIQANENMPTDCPSYVLTSTEVPEQVFLSEDLGTAPLFKAYDIKDVKAYASSRGDNCTHVSRHFATMDNFGELFGGVTLSGKPYTHVLQESEYPMDLTMQAANERGAFYDKFEDAVTFHLPVGTSYYPITDHRSDFEDEQIDYVRFCTDAGILLSVWSDTQLKSGLDKKDIHIHGAKATIRQLVQCDGSWTYSVKSKSSEPVQRETVRELFIAGFRSYYTHTDQLNLLENRKWFPTAEDCPRELQLFSEEGMCLQYLPPSEKTAE